MHKVRIDWAAVDGATGYNVYRRIVGGEFELIASATNNYYIDNVEAVGGTTTYEYAVATAVDEEISGKSGEVKARLEKVYAYDLGGRDTTVGYVNIANNDANVIYSETNGFGLIKKITGTPNNAGPTLGTHTLYDNLRMVTEVNFRQDVLNGVYQVWIVAGSGADDSVYYIINGDTKSDVTGRTINYLNYGVSVEDGKILVEGASGKSKVGRTGAIVITPLKYSPTGISATVAADLSKVELTWESDYTDETYYILRADIGSDEYEVIGNTTEKSFSDNTIEVGSEYQYKVALLAVNGQYAYSAVKEVQVYDASIAAPATPAGVNSVRTATDKVTVSWTTVVGAVKYFVYGKLESASEYELLATVEDTTYVHADLNENQNYCYKIVAANNGGKSAESTVTVCKALVPDMPTGLTATDVSYATVTLGWETTSRTDKYLVYRATAEEAKALELTGALELADVEDFTLAGEVTVNTFRDTDVEAATEYVYFVLAQNEGGASGVAVCEVKTSIIPVKPTIPENVVAVSTAMDISISWNSVIGANSYNVYRATALDGEYIALATEVTATSYSDTTAELGKTYYYKVVAVNVAGSSDESAVVNGELKEAYRKYDFGTTTLEDGYTQVTASDLYSEGGEYGFKELNSNLQNHKSGGTGNLFVDCVRITQGSAATTNSFIVELENGTYDIVLGTGNSGDYSSTFKFMNGAGKELCGSASYTESGTYHSISRSGLEITDGKLVIEITSGKTRFASINYLVISKSADAAEAPTGLEAEASENEIVLTWNAAEGATSYNVYRALATDGKFIKIANTTEAAYTYDIRSTIKYHFKVTAVNAAGESAASDIAVSEVATTMLPCKEDINRGLVAVKADAGVFLSWRLLEEDTTKTYFAIYRNGEFLAYTADTNYLDEKGTVSNTYKVVPYIGEEAGAASDTVKVWTENYIAIPLDIPADGVTPAGDAYSYTANDVSVADLDGDGEYEFIVKWQPTNAQDNSNAGYTGNTYIDAYEYDGTKLWRIDLGINIRSGAHYTQFMVYDFDCDGKAELAVKTADGTKDAAGNVIGVAIADYRNANGYILEGPEYLTVFDGETGVAIDTVEYIPSRGNVADWGDSYGNRVDRFLAAVAYLDGETPSFIMCRGYYSRMVLAAYNLVDGEIVEVWTFDTNEVPSVDGVPITAQGNHNLVVADVDDDGCDEILYGASAFDNDGTALYSTKLGHGDAMHVSDIVLDRPGLEVFCVHEETTSIEYHIEVHDALTGEIIYGEYTGVDTGRGVSADIDPNYKGMEYWASKSGLGGMYTSTTGEKIVADVSTLPPINFTIFWDGDLLSELYDGGEFTTPFVYKYMDAEGNLIKDKIYEFEGTTNSNGTKANPGLIGDITGDWREEVIVRSEDSEELRIYTTTIDTEYRLTTLLADHQYRMALAWQNVGYNQPAHTSYYMGTDMEITTAFDGVLPDEDDGDSDDNDDDNTGSENGGVGESEEDDSEDSGSVGKDKNDYSDPKYAPEGSWEAVDGKWQYKLEDGSLMKGWLKDGLRWYWLDEKGTMLTGWVKDENNLWYYMSESGAMSTGWLKDGEDWYYLSNTGAMSTGWIKEVDKWYYLNSDGKMATDWVYVGNEWYYLNPNGDMATGWMKENDRWYYLDAALGAMHKGWVADAGKKYYLGKDGAMCTGWLLVDNKWYYADSTGAILTGWVSVDGKWYYLDSDGRCLMNTTTPDGHKVDKDGARIN